MKKRKSKSWSLAYCGMAAALCVALMLLGTIIPIAMFIAPAVASFLIATSCETLPAGTSTSSRPYMASTAALHSSSLHTSCNARGRMRSNRGFTSG